MSVHGSPFWMKLLFNKNVQLLVYKFPTKFMTQ